MGSGINLDDGFELTITGDDGSVTRYRSRKRKRPPKPPKPAPPPTAWNLDINDLIVRTGKSRRWLFEHSDELPFIRRVTKKTIIGNAVRLERWLDGERRR
ncbi:MAG TPA: hypothetical protein VMF50_07850 [Candidatus Binataceae bacterium]|nr:hypothetical protein [Candidatus Binataceae bacterium]